MRLSKVGDHYCIPLAIDQIWMGTLFALTFCTNLSVTMIQLFMLVLKKYISIKRNISQGTKSMNFTKWNPQDKIKSF